ncbi:helix-turn-helix domain-containing protein [Butyrivibrio sp. WCE2006]|uniref:helix-turn-helix domain-containing protein n=1 Tax=Butyrivibrio sp. WCE2006 TaxID=1410611 RepID=UPI0005D206B7|nr:helix-turn-helix transcriptional regulator [Butyrivibrio sp. WCE2006]
MENQIKELRKRRGISQQKCADDLGISMRTLQRYEKGETENLTFFVKLADYLNVNLEVLLHASNGGEKNEQTE